MYSLATSQIIVTRGTTTNAMGDQVAGTTVVYQGNADIQPSSNRYTDFATQTPRTVFDADMAVASNAGIRSGDFVQDITFGVKYVVQDVTTPYGPLIIGDLTCGLKRVG